MGKRGLVKYIFSLLYRTIKFIKLMKTYSLLFLAAALVATTVSLMSCSKIENIDQFGEEKNAVKFSSNIITMNPATRANGKTWNENDKIGVYMLESDTIVVVNAMSNVQYITEGGGSTGSFKAVSDTIYFPDNGKEVRFMSYYPYTDKVVSNENGDVYKVDVSDQNNQAAIDLLYSFRTDTVFEKTASKKVVPLVFNHMLTKLIVNIKAGKGLKKEDLANITIHFEGLSTAADFNLFSGSLSNYADTTNIVPLTVAQGESFEAILIPTAEIPSNAKIVFDLDNVKEGEGISSDVFTWSFDKKLIKSTKHIYNVTINRTGIEIEATINDWINGGEEGITAE